jgi:hypothetical protein
VKVAHKDNLVEFSRELGQLSLNYLLPAKYSGANCLEKMSERNSGNRY